MNCTRFFMGLPLVVLAVMSPALADSSSPDSPPATQPSIHKTDLLGQKFSSHVHGIEFRPPADCVQIDKASADTIVEFDRDDYNWQMKAWSVRLERSLPLTVHKDQYGSEQDGVMEITLANIKQQTPSEEVLRNEVINVGRVRVGMKPPTPTTNYIISSISPVPANRNPSRTTSSTRPKNSPTTPLPRWLIPSTCSIAPTSSKCSGKDSIAAWGSS